MTFDNILSAKYVKNIERTSILSGYKSPELHVIHVQPHLQVKMGPLWSTFADFYIHYDLSWVVYLTMVWNLEIMILG